MATVFPASFKALIKICFSSGLTLPKTSYFKAESLISSSLCKVDKSMAFKLSPTLARLAIFKTVFLLSPEIILTFTPWSLKYLIVDSASFLILS